MFGKPKEIKPEPQPNFTADDDLKTRKYLLRNLRWYLDEDGDDPEYIEKVCQIIDALNKLKGL